MNKKEFVEYLKRRFGYPMISLEVADVIIDDIIMDAKSLFGEDNFNSKDYKNFCCARLRDILVLVHGKYNNELINPKYCEYLLSLNFN